MKTVKEIIKENIIDKFDCQGNPIHTIPDIIKLEREILAHDKEMLDELWNETIDKCYEKMNCKITKDVEDTLNIFRQKISEMKGEGK